MFYAQKRYDEAVRYAKRAIERKADCEGAYNILGRALFSSDRSEEAASLADRALEANGDDYNTYIPYGNALMLLGRKDEAARVDLRFIAALERQRLNLRRLFSWRLLIGVGAFVHTCFVCRLIA